MGVNSFDIICNLSELFPLHYTVSYFSFGTYATINSSVEVSLFSLFKFCVSIFKSDKETRYRVNIQIFIIRIFVA